MYRIGFGYDVHRLVTGRKLILGGIEIPHDLGLLGHSDADVLTHAIMDALLGAISKGDIGRHFPDHDPRYKDMSSLILLNKVIEMVKVEGYGINNLDTTIVAQKPKLLNHFKTIKEKLSPILGTKPDMINIKATTTEGLGPMGRQEGIEAYAIVSLIRIKNEKWNI